MMQSISTRHILFFLLYCLYQEKNQKSCSCFLLHHSLEMGKIWVEVCIISARGLQRSSSFFKLQWYAVGWVDPENKYCTKMDASGNTNPVWKTRFSTCAEESEFEDLGLTVEVYSREPIFLRQSLLGSVTVVLKEFVDKYYGSKSDGVRKPVEEVGSFQLRKKNSNKPVGFVDVSVRVSEEREEPGSSHLGGESGINLDIGYGSLPTAAPHLSPTTSQQPENKHFMQFPPNYPYHPTAGPSHYPSRLPPPFPPNYPHRPVSGPNYPPATGPSNYMSRPPPPPPPPPSNIGYTPNVFPMNTSSYINMPSSVAPAGRGARPGVGMGVGAGALAAGAVIFGDDFLSGFDVPGVDISINPPF